MRVATYPVVAVLPLWRAIYVSSRLQSCDKYEFCEVEERQAEQSMKDHTGNVVQELEEYSTIDINFQYTTHSATEGQGLNRGPEFRGSRSQSTGTPRIVIPQEAKPSGVHKGRAVVLEYDARKQFGGLGCLRKRYQKFWRRGE